MAKLARTNMDSFVWDRAMGSAGFLVSAMDIMIKDAQAKIHDQKELEKKITNIKEHQLLGVEILGNIYILAVLNMILMGDASLLCGWQGLQLCARGAGKDDLRLRLHSDPGKCGQWKRLALYEKDIGEKHPLCQCPHE